MRGAAVKRLALATSVIALVICLMPEASALDRAAAKQTWAAGDITCSFADEDWNSGDGSTNRCHSKWTSKYINSDPNLFRVFALGDLQYVDGTLEEFNNSYNIQGQWGARFPTKTRPVLGNHEYNTGDADGYFDYWTAEVGTTVADEYENGNSGSEPGCPVADPQCGYYSQMVGTKWLLLALNTECGGADPEPSCSAQAQWIADTIDYYNAEDARNVVPCIIAIGHHPRWTTTTAPVEDGIKNYIWPALADNSVDIYLAGHVHNFQAWPALDSTGHSDTANGTRQYIVGSGGEEIEGSPSWDTCKNRDLDNVCENAPHEGPLNGGTDDDHFGAASVLLGQTTNEFDVDFYAVNGAGNGSLSVGMRDRDCH